MNKLNQMNDLLVHFFFTTLDVEEEYLIQGEFSNISVNDMHIIDAIGPDTTINMSSIAKKVGVTVGTLTIAINGLVRKEYVTRVRSEEDRRVVLITLSDKGVAAYKRHQEFHNEIMAAIGKGLTDEEQDVFMKGLTTLKACFEDINK